MADSIWNSMRVFLLDNYDSFTYNLYHLLSRFTDEIDVRRNDAISLDELLEIKPDSVFISPGPKEPVHAGISKEIVHNLGSSIPIFGVCLGMQAINEVFGGSTVHAPVPVHGKTSFVYHNEHEMFAGIPSPFRAARYHSLCVNITSNEIQPTAHTDDGTVMALRHTAFPIWGVQYHPESFMSEYGSQILKNFFTVNGLC